MILLRNYSEIYTNIIIENNVYSIQREEDANKPIQGVGGFSEDGQLIGIYVENDKLFFLQNEKVYEITPSELICINEYIDKSKRCFSVTIGDRKVCEIVYKPFIDPGMIYYDADPEEFDVLLYISGLLKDKESMQNFIKGMHNIKEEYKR